MHPPPSASRPIDLALRLSGIAKKADSFSLNPSVGSS